MSKKKPATQATETLADTGKGVPPKCGTVWPDSKCCEGDYVAERRAADPNYAYGHDGRLWAIV